MSNTAALQPVTEAALPEALEEHIRRTKMQVAGLEKLMTELLKPGTDFDRVQVTDRPTLLQPGAQLLCQVFRLAPSYRINVERDLDRPFLAYQVTCQLVHMETGQVVGEGVGSANSREKKHRWRWEGEGENRARVENEEVFDLDNTLCKMAKKRAYVDATLTATGASRLFTQDLEDMMPDLEKASKKQAGFVRSLLERAGAKTEDAMLAWVSELAGRQVPKLDDLSRAEASAIISALKGDNPAPPSNANGGASGNKPATQPNTQPAGNVPPPATDQTMLDQTCEECGNPVPSGQAAFSQHHFRLTLCPTCCRNRPR